jgi:hypothetical protein
MAIAVKNTHTTWWAAILAGMEVTGLGWCGTRTEHDQQLADFYEHVLGWRPLPGENEPGL